jgi:hypothetical protein
MVYGKWEEEDMPVEKGSLSEVIIKLTTSEKSL